MELDKEYIQIGIKSHGKGIFYKEAIKGKELGNKRVFWIEPNCFVVNIVFAWERAVVQTSEKENGMIASHRFPMYKTNPVLANLDYITKYFVTKKGQNTLQLASPGGAGRNKTLGQSEFLNSTINLPCLQEQLKIANFLTLLDERISKQRELVENLKSYKRGVVFSTFKKNNPFKIDMSYSNLSDLLTEYKCRETKDWRVCSVAVGKGVVDQIEHLGRSFSAKNTDNYGRVKYGDIIYTKSPTGSFPYGIIKQNFLDEDVAVSPLYAVYEPKSIEIGYLLHIYFEQHENTNNYVKPLAQKGAKNTINISNSKFLDGKVVLPNNPSDINKLTDLFKNLDKKIEAEKLLLSFLETQKDAILGLMFI